MNSTTRHLVDVRLETTGFETIQNEMSGQGPGVGSIGFWIDVANQHQFVDWFVKACEFPNEAVIYRLPPDSSRCRFFVQWRVSPNASSGHSKSHLLVQESHSHAKGLCLVAIQMKAVHSNFWIPINTCLSPKPHKTDWQDMQEDDVLNVWHPGIGLCEIPIESGLGLHDLLRLPEGVAKINWTAAVERPSFPERLISIRARPIDNLDEWFQTSAGDIGKDSQQLGALKPAKSELHNAPMQRAVVSVSAAAAVALVGIAGAVSKLASGIKSLFVGNEAKSVVDQSGAGDKRGYRSNTPDKNAWMESIRKWAAQQVNALNELIETRRNSAIHRLMEMLERNPEEGLRYAIPMSDDAFRGISKPGTELVRRDLRWASGGGTGSSDPWTLEQKARERLRAKYLELALQEKRLGRFERAAYIYAKLLGDYGTAATVLEQGKLFREAAAVYATRLKNSLMAASCFRKAGDFEEAIRIFREQEAFLESGKLLDELEQVDDAKQDFRLHVASCCRLRKWTEAADCLVDRLDATEEAVELLREQWPRGIDNDVCFKKTLQILQQSDQSRRIVDQIRRLVEDERVVCDQAWPLQCLVELAQRNTDREIATTARQSVFRIAGHHLQSKQTDATNRALVAIRNMETNDLVLKRDTHRFHQGFLARRHEPQPDSLRGIKSTASESMKATYEGQLKQGVNWRAIFLTPNEILAVGEDDVDLVVQACQLVANDSFKVNASEYRVRNCLAPVTFPRWVRGCVDPDPDVRTCAVFVAGCTVSSDFKYGPEPGKLGRCRPQIVYVSSDVADVVPWARMTDEALEKTSYIRMTATEFEIRSLLTGFSSEHAADLQPRFPSIESEESMFDDLSDSDSMDKDEMQHTQGYESGEGQQAYLPRLAESANYWFVGWGRELRILNGKGLVFADCFHSPIVELIPSPARTRGRILVVTQHDVSIQWLNLDNWRRQTIATDLLHPCALLLRDGRIVVGHSTGIHVYSNQGPQSRLLAEIDSKSPIERLCLDSGHNQFWSVDRIGSLVRWKFVHPV